MASPIKALQRMVFGRTNENRWLFFGPSMRKHYRKVGNGSNTSVVAAPLLWIHRNFPEAPPALWLRTGVSGEEDRVTGKGDQGGDHIMLELLERPNEYYSGSALWAATVTDWHISGDAYWIKLRDIVGRPRELWWAPSGTMKPIGSETEFITHYEYKPGTQTIDLPPEDVVHFRYGMSAENPRCGKSPLSSLLQEVFTDVEASEFTAALLGNMGVPGVLISPSKEGGTPSDDDVKATKAKFKGGFSGDNRGEPLIMSGPTNVEQFGFSPEQMNLRTIRRIPEERVTACLGVPAIVAGLGAGLDRSTFANYSEAREAAYDDCIIPAQRTMSEEVKYQLLPDFEPDDFRSFRFGFDISNVRILQEDRNTMAERYDKGIRGGWVRVSEGRRALDLEIDDADEVYLRGVAVIEVPVGEAGPAPTPAQLSPGQSEQPASLPEAQPGQQTQTSGRKAVALSRLHTRLHHALLRDAHVISGHFSRELDKDFASFGRDCASTYLHLVSQTSSTNGHGAKAISADRLARMITSTLAGSFTEALNKRFRTNAARTLEQTVATISDIANLTGGVSDPVQEKILNSGGKRIGLVDIEQSTRDVLLNAINSGNELGLNPREIARNIRTDVPAGRFVNAGPAYRSQLIARTETNWAMNTSAIATYREADEVEMCIAMDGSDDEDCAARNGQEYTFDEAEAELESEHPNGTLTFAPVIGAREEVPA